jgi:mitogen-activated protein kinase kinase 7
VWSLGITLVELAMQKFPYEADSDFAVLSKIMADPPPALPADRFSAPFCDFVRQCLMKDTKSRPKYKKLLEHPFIQIYDSKPVDVAAWFATTGCQ